MNRFRGSVASALALSGLAAPLLVAGPAAAKIVILGSNPSGWEFTTDGAVNGFFVPTGPLIPVEQPVTHFILVHVINYGTGGMAGSVDTVFQGIGQSFVTTFLKGGGLGGGGSVAALAGGAPRVQFASLDSSNDIAQLTGDPAQPVTGDWGGWAQGFGDAGTIGSVGPQGTLGSVSNLSLVGGGAAFGIDRRIDPTLTIGLGVSYAHTDAKFQQGDARAYVNSAALAAYGTKQLDGAYLSGTVGYAYDVSDNQRGHPQFPPFDTARATEHANEFFGGLELGYEAATILHATLTPFIQFQAVTLHQNGYSEDGSSLIDLVTPAATYSTLTGTVGLEFDRRFAIEDETPVDVSFRAGWARELLNQNRDVTVTFVTPPNPQGLLLAVAKPARDSARFSLGAARTLDADNRLYVRYDGDVSAKDNENMLTAGLGFSF